MSIKFMILILLIIGMLVFLDKKKEMFVDDCGVPDILNKICTISLQDKNNNYNSSTITDGSLGIKINNYTTLKSNEYYKDSFVYTGSNTLLDTKWVITGITLNEIKIINNKYNVYLGFGTIESGSKKSIYVTTKDKYNDDCLWKIENVNCATFSIKHIKTGWYLGSSNMSLNHNTYVEKNTPNLYYKFGVIYCSDEKYNWLILPEKPNLIYSNNPTYGSNRWSYNQAINFCRNQGKKLCSKNDLSYYYKLGYSNCNCSWLNDTQNNQASIGYPMVNKKANCGDIGVNSCQTQYRYPKQYLCNQIQWTVGSSPLTSYPGNGLHTVTIPSSPYQGIPIYSNRGKDFTEYYTIVKTGNGGNYRITLLVGLNPVGSVYNIQLLCRGAGVTCCPEKKFLESKDINFTGTSWTIDDQWFNQSKVNGVGARIIWPFFSGYLRYKKKGYSIIGTIVNNSNKDYNSGEGMTFLGTNTGPNTFSLKVLRSRDNSYLGTTQTINLDKTINSYTPNNTNLANQEYQQFLQNEKDNSQKILENNKLNNITIKINVITLDVKYAGSNMRPSVTIIGTKGYVNKTLKIAGKKNTMENVDFVSKDIGDPVSILLRATNKNGWLFKDLKVKVGDSPWYLFNNTNGYQIMWLDGQSYDSLKSYSGYPYRDNWNFTKGEISKPQPFKNFCGNNKTYWNFTNFNGKQIPISQGSCRNNRGPITCIDSYRVKYNNGKPDKRGNYGIMSKNRCSGWRAQGGNWYYDKKSCSPLNCEETCQRDKNCDAYLIDPNNNKQCFNYTFKSNNKSTYNCHIPFWGGGFYGNLKYNNATNAEQKPYINMGCWKDRPNRAITPSITGYNVNQQPRINMSVEECAKMAKKNGFKVFGLQDGGQCFSGPNAEKTYNKYGSTNNCPSNGLGTGWVNNVYGINSENFYKCYAKLDNWCKTNVGEAYPYGRKLPGLASQGQSKPEWRCYSQNSLTSDTFRYNTSNKSPHYATKPQLKNVWDSCIN